MKIFDNKDSYEKLNNIAEYKGYMIDAPHYVIILSDAKNGYIENSGYMGEWWKNENVIELDERGLLDAFSYARMAPSSLNRQPWRFIIDGVNIVLAVKKDDFTSDYEGSIDTGIAMLYFSLILDTTMLDLQWNVGSVDKDYKIPDDYEIVGYCSI